MENGRTNHELDKAVLNLEKLFNVKIESMEKALQLARKDLNYRLEGMNEFREQLRNQASTFITRESSELRLQVLENRITSLENKKSNLEGRMWIIPTIIVIIQIGILLFKSI